MNRLFYNIVLYIILPFIPLRLLWRSKKAPAYRKRMTQRFALNFSAIPKKHGIWVHAVSVGESIAAAPMINALLRTYPDLVITVTCMTPTGSERIKSLFGSRVQHCYMPYDVPCMAKRFLKKLQPKLAIIMETELWPNHVFYCKKMNIPVILANARLSARSARGYARFPKLIRPMFASLDWIAAQSETEAQRFLELGANPEHVSVIGSIKFDINIESELTEQAALLRKNWGTIDRPTWIAASTHEGEDEIVLEAHRQLLAQNPSTLLIIVPRHPERFEAVYKLCTQHFNTIPRSSKVAVTDSTQVFMGDTMGELLFLYALADIAFVGGSLVENGGHNILEPVALHIPVISGPHLFNFQEIANQLIAEKALATVHNSQELFLQLKKLTEKNGIASQMIQGGEKVMQRNQGALESLLEGIDKRLYPQDQANSLSHYHKEKLSYDMNFLKDMYEDSYFPDFLVDKIKAQLLVVEKYLQEGSHSPEEIQAKLDAMTQAINELQQEFWDNNSDLETAARDSIAQSVEDILNKHNVDIDLETALQNRDW